MMWLWLTTVWMVLACAAGLWLGAALHVASRNDAVRRSVERALSPELVDR
ncbi:hypothetical protein TEK04_14025 [Klenkia sp. LSe6-5]|uniref:Uncharacterized protein n=1 Tax=Klenkia sesuvii TaxID=3103137 RepID=A0ABU8DVG9_9ACTN